MPVLTLGNLYIHHKFINGIREENAHFYYVYEKTFRF